MDHITVFCIVFSILEMIGVGEGIVACVNIAGSARRVLDVAGCLLSVVNGVSRCGSCCCFHL